MELPLAEKGRKTLCEEQVPDEGGRRSDPQIFIRHPSGDIKLEVRHKVWSTEKWYRLEIKNLEVIDIWVAF